MAVGPELKPSSPLAHGTTHPHHQPAPPPIALLQGGPGKPRRSPQTPP